MDPDREEDGAGHEAPLEPERRIVDPHLHLWDIPRVAEALQEAQTFLVPEAARLIAASGHRITHSVFVECHAMYRPGGPDAYRSLGETEFATGMAAMAASGLYGPCRLADRIIANINLCDDGAERVIEAHQAVAGDRFRGVRMNTAFSPAGLFGWSCDPALAQRLADPALVAGARVLAGRGLSLDIWCLHPQLRQVIQLARAIPELSIILDHVGTPDTRGSYGEHPDVALHEWRAHIGDLAELSNVVVKISGLGMDVTAPLSARTGRASSVQLAEQWRWRVNAVVDAFGPARCMFASNYPADRSAGSYGAIWNAFKRLAQDYSEAEKEQLFRGTAAATYDIALEESENGSATNR